MDGELVRSLQYWATRNGSLRAAGMVTNPGGTERLHQYWVHGEGAARIQWEAPGSFDRCVTELGKYIRDPEGYCNLAHHAATGRWYNTGGTSGRAAMATSTKAPYGAVTYADPGYQADKVKRYPLDSEEHCRAAWSYINQADNAAKYSSEHLAAIKGRIKSALKKYGVQVSEDQPSGRAESLMPYFRSFPLEDIHVRSSGDGRTVEAYAAVFGVSTEVRDQDGHYTEEIDPAAFNKAISDAAPQGSRRGWKVGVFYNHGMTIHGTPSERGAMPVGVPLEIVADSRGLKTVTRYHRGEFCDEILDRIREGSLPGYSFTGNFRRSRPMIPRGGFRPDYRNGTLPHVRRIESTLVEYGPTPLPIYEDAAITAMRGAPLLGAMAADPELAQRMISMLSASTPGEPLSEPGTPFDEEQPPRSRLVHSGRPVKQEIQAARSAFLQRHRRNDSDDGSS